MVSPATKRRTTSRVTGADVITRLIWRRRDAQRRTCRSAADGLAPAPAVEGGCDPHASLVTARIMSLVRTRLDQEIQFGGRRSRNAVMPSCASFDAKSRADSSTIWSP